MSKLTRTNASEIIDNMKLPVIAWPFAFLLVFSSMAAADDPYDGAVEIPLVVEDYRGQQSAIIEYLKRTKPELMEDREVILLDIKPAGRVRTLKNLQLGWFDVDGDGRDEMFLVNTLEHCGNIGCELDVLKLAPGGLEYVTGFNADSTAFAPTRPFQVLLYDETSCDSVEIVPRASPPWTLFGRLIGTHWVDGEWDYFELRNPLVCDDQNRVDALDDGGEGGKK